MGKKDHHIRNDITGKRFGRLTVMGLDHYKSHSLSYWLCRCDCGNEIVAYKGNLTSGRTTSCGCYFSDRVTTHGLSRSPLYKIWEDMKTRCNNDKSNCFHRYGGRGISICDEWNRFEPFYDWAVSSGYETGLTIDRIDNDDGYYPENCRWVDLYVQANNTSRNHIVEYYGVKHTIAEWARLFDVNYNTLWKRINNNDMHDFESFFRR